jgi:hypothetical protein
MAKQWAAGTLFADLPVPPRYEFERYYCSARPCGTRKRDPEKRCRRCGNRGTVVDQRGKRIPWAEIRQRRVEEREALLERLNNLK